MTSVFDTGGPVLVIFAMVVGMELTIPDFRLIARHPGIVVATTMAQFVLVPVIGWLLVHYLDLLPAVTRGVLLVAEYSSGGMANVYTKTNPTV